MPQRGRSFNFFGALCSETCPGATESVILDPFRMDTGHLLQSFGNTFQSLTVRSLAASMSRELLGRAHHLTLLIFSLISKLCITSNCTGTPAGIKVNNRE